MPDVDDATLLRRAAGGDSAAFGSLYDRLAPMLLLRLRSRCADAEMVSDVLQEAFTSAWKAANQWDGRGEVAAWIWTIAARRLVDAFRRRAVRTATDLRTVATAVTAAPSAESVALEGLYDSSMEVALAGLSPELRQVLQATVLDGLSTREAAVLLGIPEGTVKARAARARANLRQALA